MTFRYPEVKFTSNDPYDQITHLASECVEFLKEVSVLPDGFKLKMKEPINISWSKAMEEMTDMHWSKETLERILLRLNWKVGELDDRVIEKNRRRGYLAE